MTTVLLTGFAPFGGDSVNPSGEAVVAVAAGWDRPETLVTEILPVTFAGSSARMRALLAAHSPDVVIATGLAGGTDGIRVERIAVNLIDARIPDNDGAQPIDDPSVPGGPTAHFATLPVKAIAEALRGEGIPAHVSHSAGTFVCNHTMFTTLDAAPPGTRAGFIHVPWAHGQGPEGAPSLPAADLTRALRRAIEVCLDAPTDARGTAGALH